MSEFIENNLKVKNISLIEASPGTGKTMAYLAPIALKASEKELKLLLLLTLKRFKTKLLTKTGFL